MTEDIFSLTLCLAVLESGLHCVYVNVEHEYCTVDELGETADGQRRAAPYTLRVA